MANSALSRVVFTITVAPGFKPLRTRITEQRVIQNDRDVALDDAAVVIDLLSIRVNARRPARAAALRSRRTGEMPVRTSPRTRRDTRAAQQPLRGEAPRPPRPMRQQFLSWNYLLDFQKAFLLSCYVGEILRRKELSLLQRFAGAAPGGCASNMLGIFKTKVEKRNSMIVMRYKKTIVWAMHPELLHSEKRRWIA